MNKAKEYIKDIKEAQKTLENAKKAVKEYEISLENSVVDLFDKCINGKSIKFNKLTRKYGDVRLKFYVDTKKFYEGDSQEIWRTKTRSKVTITVPQKGDKSVKDLLVGIADVTHFNLFYEPFIEDSFHFHENGNTTTTLNDGVYTVEGEVDIWFWYLTELGYMLVDKKITILED